MPENPFDAALRTVAQLADAFAAQESHYLSAAYQEAEVRKDFIDKLFFAGGRDVGPE